MLGFAKREAPGRQHSWQALHAFPDNVEEGFGEHKVHSRFHLSTAIPFPLNYD